MDDIADLDERIQSGDYRFARPALNPDIAEYTWAVLNLRLDVTGGLRRMLDADHALNSYLGPAREYRLLCNQAAERAAVRRRLEEAAMAFESDNAKHGKLLRDLKDEIDAMVDEAVGPHSEEERREIEAAGQKAVQEHKAKLQEFQREFHKGLEEHRTRRWGIAAIALLDVLILLGGYVCAAIVIRQWWRDRRNRDRAGAAK